MRRKRRLRVIALCVVLSLAFCLGLQYMAACDLQDRNARIVSPVYDENTLLRLQNIPNLTGNCVFMGSSMTERYPITKNISVIGVPSSSFLAACTLLDDQHKEFPPGTTYILEMNCIFKGRFEDVIAKTRTWKFRELAGSKVFSMAARPVNQIVSYMYLLSKGSDREISEDECFDVPVTQPEEYHGEEPTEKELEEWSEILEKMKELRAKGGKLCIAYYPSRDLIEFEERYKKAMRLAAYADVPLLNYNKPEWLPRVVFTDRHHMKQNIPETAKFRNTVARDARKCAR